MSDLSETFAAIHKREAVRKVSREEVAAQNRLNFPNAANVMDQFKAFNPRLIWAEEGGKSIGKVPEKK